MSKSSHFYWYAKPFLTLWLFNFLVIANSTAFVIGQGNSDVLKFDELTVEPNVSYSERERIVQERITRFVAETKRQPNKLKYLVHYRSRVRQDDHHWNGSSLSWARSAKHAAASIGRTYNDRDILVLDGGVRENETLEFWFVSRGELPKVISYFERSEVIDCPSIIAYQSAVNFDKAQAVVLTARAGSDGDRTFKWSVSEGRIIGPNNGSRLEVDVSSSTTNRLTAFLEVDGLPIPCKNRAIVVAEFGHAARLLDSFGHIPNGDFRGRTDAFLTELANHADKLGYVYLYGNRSGQGRDSAARKRLLLNHISSRNFDVRRIKIVDAGFREDISTEYWLIPPGVDAPTPTPTVDSQFVMRKTPSKTSKRRKPN